MEQRIPRGYAGSEAHRPRVLSNKDKKMLHRNISTDDTGSRINYFDIVRADTPSLVDEAYRLRYQVYCLENPFENAGEHIDGRERDADDDRSIHTLLVHRRTGAFAGTARVILPTGDGSDRPLPIHRLLASQHRSFAGQLPPHATAEISRFAVSKEFRRRCGEERHADAAVAGGAPAMLNEHRAMPYITFGLIRGVLEICDEYSIAHICAVMEPALIRILGRFGLDFESIGDLVEHHGMRQPCVGRLADLVERSRANSTLLWQYTAERTPRSRSRAT
jgi:N-acyl amino acid synthase of PEP-CTERM/exosortase system